MHLLPEKSFENKDTQSNRKEKSSNFEIRLFLVSLLVGIILIVVASLQNSDQTEEEQLALLQAKIEKHIPLGKYEKEAYCDLLWKVKQVRLCACMVRHASSETAAHQPDFFVDIGSLTRYKVKDSGSWRDSGRTFEEALQEAFRRTGVPRDRFIAEKWAKDLNGKSGVVEWKGIGGAEVSIDPPHETDGPDVFHIGFKTSEKGKKELEVIFL
ncbi:MAG TPA: polymorphic toxin type 47 domain-containing protein [Leptospiraceae bacterium]|nr:polymorphic toxin type 47 domain-containing protein [Leptospiraceae bacterium]HRG77674.1 polymorphic toxin type 47 domain-containing protein [Leptospiraceae bacterium]